MLNKILKYVVSTIIIALLIIPVSQTTSMAADETPETIINGTFGENITWGIDTEYTLTIDGTGTLPASSVPWSSFEANIKKIVVSNGITKIEKGVFKNCKNVEEMVLPFVGMSANASKIQEGVFGHIFGCTFKTPNDPPVTNTDLVEQYGYSEKIQGTWWNYTYYYPIPKTLRKVTITDDSSIPKNAFKNCGFLTEINISDKTKTIASGAFSYCKGITSFGLFDSITEVVDDSFYGCTKLTDIYFKGTRGSFYSITGVSVFANDTIHYSDNGTCGDNATWEITYDDKLLIDGEGTLSSSGYIAYFDVIKNVCIGEGITDLSNIRFSALTTNTAFEVDADNPYLKSESGVVYSKDGKTLVAVPAGMTGEFTVPDGVETIAVSAFENCAGITEVTLPDTVSEIGANALKNCSALTRVMYNGTSEQWSNVTVNSGNELMSGVLIIGKYIIDYDVNTGEGVFERQIKLYNQSINLYSHIPTKAGHTFKGWSTVRNGEVVYQKGASYSPDSDVVLYAVWEIDTYNVTFNANGGSSAPETQIKTYNISMALSSVIPVRQGYTFTGWAESAAGEVKYLQGDSYTKNEPVQLYAIWAANRYTVTYNANTGTGSMDVTEHTYDVEKNISTNLFSKTGYTFMGWSDIKGGENAYDDGASVKNLTHLSGGNVTLYAVWKANSYTVAFHSNGGEGNTYTSTCTYDEKKALPVNSFARLGYTFVGWATEAAGDVVYRDGQEIINMEYRDGENVDLYAVWEINKYNVLYNANTGTGAPQGQIKIYGENLVLQSDIPKKTGYTFKGWSTSANGNVEYASGGTYVANQSVELYAVWQIDTYLISFDANGGENAPEAMTKTYNIDLTLSAETPVRTGYRFMGWASSADGYAEYSAGDTYSKNGEQTLYAVWTANYYSVEYNANSGTGSMSSGEHVYDTEKELEVNAFEKTGYTFKGWATTPEGEAIYTDGEQVLNLTSEHGKTVVLYAVWQANTYTVTYSPNGGTGVEYKVTHTYDVGKVLNTNSFYKTGHSFKGWATDANGLCVYGDAENVINLTADVKGNITLYAIWEPDRYTVTYNANGGAEAPAGQQKVYGVELTLSDKIPVKTGYTFKGWATSAEGDAEYTAGGSYTSNQPIDLYAVWQANTYTITYSPNGGTGEEYMVEHTYDRGRKIEANSFSKDGHTFRGWSTEIDGEAVYNPGEEVINLTTVDGDNIALYAVWEIDKYSITYDANSGTGAPEGQVKIYGTDLALSGDAPAKAGHIFKGWALSSNGTVKYMPGDAYTENGPAILYAVWEIEKYSVTYDANGGTNAPDSQEKIYNISINISTETPAKTGHIFKGWATSANGEIKYVPGGVYWENKPTVLYAVWEAEKYRISYDANGGTDAPVEQFKTYGTQLIISESVPVKTGHVFKGWATSAEGMAEYMPGSAYTEEGSAVLYAVWTPEIYEIVYDATGGEKQPEIQNKTYGIAVTLSGIVPVQKGKLFKGWATTKTGKVKYHPGDEYILEKGMTLYAVWEDAEPGVTLRRKSADVIQVNVTGWEGVLVIAKYQNGAMKSYTITDITEPAVIETDRDKASEIKAFIWESRTSLKPLCKSVRMKFNTN